jgi:hypothetical protein
MDAEIKARWVTALRSGEYQQGRETMRQGDRFCCLGVLCEIDGAQWQPARSEGHPFYAVGYGVEQLEADARQELGLTDDEHMALLSMNDGNINQDEAARWGVEKRPHTFAEIADWIEGRL